MAFHHLRERNVLGCVLLLLLLLEASRMMATRGHWDAHFGWWNPMSRCNYALSAIMKKHNHSALRMHYQWAWWVGMCHLNATAASMAAKRKSQLKMCCIFTSDTHTHHVCIWAQGATEAFTDSRYRKSDTINSSSSSQLLKMHVIVIAKCSIRTCIVCRSQ